MSALIVDINLPDPDEFYEVLLSTHSDLTPTQSEALNARLVLLMANHIGDLSVLRHAMTLARSSIAIDPKTEQV
jgi:hypothetical protein